MDEINKLMERCMIVTRRHRSSDSFLTVYRSTWGHGVGPRVESEPYWLVGFHERDTMLTMMGPTLPEALTTWLSAYEGAL